MGNQSQPIREIWGGPRPKGGGPQLHKIGAEGADKAPHFGAEGAEIFEKTVLFNAKMAIFGQKRQD